MRDDEMLQKYKKNNIEMAHALNEKKIQINYLNEEMVKMQDALQCANRMRAMSNYELELKTQENEQLRKQLFERDNKLAEWRSMYIELFKTTTGKFMEVMHTIGVAQLIQRPADTSTTRATVSPAQGQISIDKSQTNVDLVHTAPCCEGPIEKPHDFTDFVGQRSSQPAFTDRTSQERKPLHEEDLIRFSKSPKIENISSGNVTVRRPTKSLTIDHSRCENELQTEETDLIRQINESLVLLEDLSHPSVLQPSIEVTERDIEATLSSDESISYSFASIALSKDSIKRLSTEHSNDTTENQKPLRPTKISAIDRKEKEENASSSSLIGSATPTVLISESENVSITDKRKSDENFLRIPKNTTSAFNTKSPRLSSNSRASTSPTSPSGINKRSSTNLQRIIERSPANSPMKSASNDKNKNMHTFSAINDKSPTNLMIKKKPNVKTLTDDAISEKKKVQKRKLIGSDNENGENEIVGPNVRPVRRAAPKDLREPLLILKMRRQNH